MVSREKDEREWDGDEDREEVTGESDEVEGEIVGVPTSSVVMGSKENSSISSDMDGLSRRSQSLSMSSVKVSLSLCKTEGSNRVLEEEHAVIRHSIERTLSKCQYIINQRLLLEDLHDSRVASPFLLQPKAAPVVGLPWQGAR